MNIIEKFCKAKVFSIALMATACVGFASCGGDDDESISANGSDTAGIITTSDGEKKLLTSVGDMKFEYDEDNKLIGVSENGYNGYSYEVSYNPFKITQTINNSNYTQTEVISDISVNGRGAITSLKSVYKYESDYSTEETTTTMSFSYDGAGHLTSISGSSTETDTEGNETETYKASGTFTLTWSNNKLVKISESTSESDGYRYAETTEFEYDDDEYPNLSHQFADNMLAETELFLFGDYEWFAYLGYYGNGGNYLPTSAYIETETNDDDDYNSTDSELFNYKYSFNSDGTLASESYKYNSNKNWITRKYTYNSMGTRSMSADVKYSNEAPQKARRGLAHIFFHKRR